MPPYIRCVASNAGQRLAHVALAATVDDDRSWRIALRQREPRPVGTAEWWNPIRRPPQNQIIPTIPVTLPRPARRVRVPSWRRLDAHHQPPLTRGCRIVCPTSSRPQLWRTAPAPTSLTSLADDRPSHRHRGARADGQTKYVPIDVSRAGSRSNSPRLTAFTGRRRPVARLQGIRNGSAHPELRQPDRQRHSSISSSFSGSISASLRSPTRRAGWPGGRSRRQS